MKHTEKEHLNEHIDTRYAYRMSVYAIYADGTSTHDWYYYDNLSCLVHNFVEEVRYADKHKKCLYYSVYAYDVDYEVIDCFEYRYK